MDRKEMTTYTDSQNNGNPNNFNDQKYASGLSTPDVSTELQL